MTNNYLSFLCLRFLYVISVSGHGNMVWPPVWQDAGGKWGLTPMGQFVIGGDIFFEYEGQPDFEKSGVVTMWYTNYTLITIEPTIEDHMRTFPNIEPGHCRPENLKKVQAKKKNCIFGSLKTFFQFKN